MLSSGAGLPSRRRDGGNHRLWGSCSRRTSFTTWIGFSRTEKSRGLNSITQTKQRRCGQETFPIRGDVENRFRFKSFYCGLCNAECRQWYVYVCITCPPQPSPARAPASAILSLPCAQCRPGCSLMSVGFCCCCASFGRVCIRQGRVVPIFRHGGPPSLGSRDAGRIRVKTFL